MAKTKKKKIITLKIEKEHKHFFHWTYLHLKFLCIIIFFLCVCYKLHNYLIYSTTTPSSSTGGGVEPPFSAGGLEVPSTRTAPSTSVSAEGRAASG